MKAGVTLEEPVDVFTYGPMPALLLSRSRSLMNKSLSLTPLKARSVLVLNARKLLLLLLLEVTSL
jgi:hypothetical protein